MSKIKMCRECRDGEIATVATCLVRGVRSLESGRKVPYRGAVCDGHLDAITEDTDITSVEFMDRPGHTPSLLRNVDYIDAYGDES